MSPSTRSFRRRSAKWRTVWLRWGFERKGGTMPVDLGQRVLPCLLSGDMRRTLDFYIGVLGFTQTGYFPIESDPIRTEVRRDGVAVIFITEAYHNVGEAPALSGMFYFFPNS